MKFRFEYHPGNHLSILNGKYLRLFTLIFFIFFLVVFLKKNIH